jgi:hypothetical protein
MAGFADNLIFQSFMWLIQTSHTQMMAVIKSLVCGLHGKRGLENVCTGTPWILAESVRDMGDAAYHGLMYSFFSDLHWPAI